MTENVVSMLSFFKAFTLSATYFCIITVASCATPDLSNRVCKTAGCIEAASLIQKNMDTKVNPCDNFYKFACGKFINETVIPDNMATVTVFTEINDQLQEKLRKSIELKLEENDLEIFKLVRSLYNICLDTEKIDMTSREELEDMLNKLGEWPVIAGKSWSESSFDWLKLVYQLREIGYQGSLKSLWTFSIGVDGKNTTRRIISLDRPVTGILQRYLYKGLKDKVVQAYYKFMVDLAVILGAERETAERELLDSLNFEMDLVKISVVLQQRQNVSVLYNLMTVEQLLTKYPDIPWVEYLNKMLSPKFHIELKDEINVKVPQYMESLLLLLSITPKRVVANYMIWRVIEESVGFMNEDMRKATIEFFASITGMKDRASRWRGCINYVSNKLPQAVGALYVRTNFDKNTKSQAENLVKDLRKSFHDMLEKVDWVDEKTKTAALSKLNAVQEYVAYPDEFLENEKLNEHYKNLKINTSSFLKSYLQTNLFDVDYSLQQLRKPVDKPDWLQHGISAKVNAFYTFSDNSIEIPAGILQGEFFNSTRPSYMNYGAIGWIIGHELTHGFDDHGSQYDKDGNMANWWDSKTKKEYLNRTRCLVDQYSNYTIAEVELKIDGKNTLGENIADNGGIKEAYMAYEEFEKNNGEEPRLPGLPYSPRQMFWISAANFRCAKVRQETQKNIIATHSPTEFRVIVSFSNMPQFAKDFNCPAGSFMNPVKKCTVW